MIQVEELDGPFVAQKHVDMHPIAAVEVHRWWTSNESGETCGQINQRHNWWV